MQKNPNSVEITIICEIIYKTKNNRRDFGVNSVISWMDYMWPSVMHDLLSGSIVFQMTG
jgi:hypothetical protein